MSVPGSSPHRQPPTSAVDINPTPDVAGPSPSLTDPSLDQLPFDSPTSDSQGTSTKHAGAPTSDQNQPGQPPSVGSTSLRMLEGSTNFKIKNSILTNAQNVTIYRFDVGSPLSEEFKTLFMQHITGPITVKDLDRTEKETEMYASNSAIKELPRVNAAHNDYTLSNMRRVACFEGTRQALLEEIAQWLTCPDGPRAYLLFGIAGIGKSTVAQTVAEKAGDLRLLGASFFFSRDELERSNAKQFFTTIAFQLCLFDKEFAQAIEKALLSEQGLAAITKDPIIQLEALILEPLRGNSRLLPTLIVVDALDECDNHDALVVLAAMNRLVRELPYFKVMMTTRPEPHLPPTLSSHKVFHLQNIEDKIVDRDIQRYLQYNLSWPQIIATMPRLSAKWSASDVEIDSLVHAAGRLFIMASTAVRFILDMTAYDPESQMQALKTDGRVSLDSLGKFYDVILRHAIPPNKPTLAQRFKTVIGTILVVQEPLPVEILEHLTQPYPLSAIRAVLANLESVIVVNNGTPRFYHKSFFDYLTSPGHCVEDLRIDMKEHHTRLATRCFEIMNNRLSQNILDLGTPARFMNNDASLAVEKISAEQLAAKIPPELQYACTYWANHVEGADSEDANLLHEVDTFVNEHLLHWLEALSWIGKLNMATHALRVILKSMKSISSDLSGIITDALHLIPKFYERIRHSALHTYYSALPFTPTESLLVKSHSKETAHCLCRPEGVAAEWDPLIAKISWRESTVLPPIHVTFSNDSSKFAMIRQKEVRLLNAENGTLLRTFKGDRMAIAYDFSTVAISQGSGITLWNVASNIPVALFTQSAEVIKLALSFDGSRLAAELSNGTVSLWDAWKGEWIANLVDNASHFSQLEFAPSSYRLALVSGDGAMQLWDGHNGKLVARLDYESQKHVKSTFSRDSCRLASLVEEGEGHSLTLWDGEKGNLIDVVNHFGLEWAMSEDGSLIATVGGTYRKLVHLWAGTPLSPLHTFFIGPWIEHLAISRGILAVGRVGTLSFHDINKNTLIVTLRRVYPQSLALSPDCTRVAIGTEHSGALYDARSLKASTPTFSGQSHKATVSALAFSPDSTRLASGFEDGTVQLWDTSHTERPLGTFVLQPHQVNTLAFSPGGERFAAGSEDKTVRIRDGRDGESIGRVEHPFTGAILAVVFSHTLLAAATITDITLFDHESLQVVRVLEPGGCSLSFSADGSVLASAYNHDSASDVTVRNIEGCVVATFNVDSAINSLVLSPDGSQLAAQLAWNDGSFRFFDVVNNQAIEATGYEDFGWIPNFMNGALISWRWDRAYGDRLLGRFLGNPDWVPVLWIPREFNISCFAVGSSIIALGCNDESVLFIRF